MDLKATTATPQEGGQQRSDVARLVWPWSEEPHPRTVRPPKSVMRRATIQSLWIAGVGLVLFNGCDRHATGSVLLGFAAVLFLLALLAPGGYRAVDRCVLWLADGVGRALNIVILAPFFYLVFSAGRLVIKLAGRDPMGSRFPAPERSSFWSGYKGRTDPASYRQQH